MGIPVRYRFAFLWFVAVLLLAACKSEGIGSLPEAQAALPDSFTINGAVYTETTMAGTPAGQDPFVVARKTLLNGQTRFFVNSGWGGAQPNTWATSVEIHVIGFQPGTYAPQIFVYKSGPQSCSGFAGGGTLTGTMTFTSYGDVGQQIIGSYAINATNDPTCTLNPISGTFEVTRFADELF